MIIKIDLMELVYSILKPYQYVKNNGDIYYKYPDFAHDRKYTSINMMHFNYVNPPLESVQNVKNLVIDLLYMCNGCIPKDVFVSYVEYLFHIKEPVETQDHEK